MAAGKVGDVELTDPVPGEEQEWLGVARSLSRSHASLGRGQAHDWLAGGVVVREVLATLELGGDIAQPRPTTRTQGPIDEIEDSGCVID